MPLTITASCRLLVRPISIHGWVVMDFWRQIRCWTDLDRSDIGMKSQLWKSKTSKSWWGLITDFAASLLSFSTPTHTHDFDNHSNGYGCLKYSARAELADCRKSDSLTASKLGFDFRIDENCDFKIIDLLIGLGSLMICTHNLYVLTKRN
jgi:hypothetical protein